MEEATTDCVFGKLLQRVQKSPPVLIIIHNRLWNVQKTPESSEVTTGPDQGRQPIVKRAKDSREFRNHNRLWSRMTTDCEDQKSEE